MITERQMEYVVAIAETGSFTAAAERCHTAQSALSHQIARLESHLGARLFDRTSRSVSLTEAGRTLLPVARRILADMAAARDELHILGGMVRGPLRIGTTQTAARLVNLLQLLVDYDRQHSDVELSVTMGPGFELLSGVASADIDIAFAALDGMSPPPGVEFVTFGCPEPLVAVVAAGHLLAHQSEVRLDQLASASRFVDFRAHTALWNKVESMCAAAGVHRRVMCEIGHLGDMVRLAASGLAVAVVPLTFTEPVDGLPSPPEEIRVLSLSEPDSCLAMGFFFQRDRIAAPAVRAFIELFSKTRHLSTRHPAPPL